MFNFFNKIKYFDLPIFICAILLSLIGSVLLYSTTMGISNQAAIIWRQLFFLFAGWLVFFFFAFFDYHAVAKSNRFLYLICLVSLLYLLLFGHIVRGGARWLNFGFFNIQPAEFVKLIIILGLARLLYLRRGAIDSTKNIFFSLLYVSLPVILILLQPDFGSALVIMIIWSILLFIGPVSKKTLIILLISGLTFGAVSWKFFLKDFQRDRVRVFVNPNLDIKGKGYNVRQAAIAIGSGKIVGKGLGQGIQGQNQFLPEKQTDFIFAAASEEIGFAGSSCLLILFAFLLYRLLLVAQRAKDSLGYYIVCGVFALFFIHIIINIGMNMGLLPVTGIPLPFLSSGGSLLIVALISLGIVQNISIQSKILRF